MNIVKDFGPSTGEQKSLNQFGFGDLRQIILYFGLSIWTHIAYRINITV